MNLLTADLVVLVFALVLAVLGLFGGFSGALAFLAALVGSALGGRLAWLVAAPRFEAAWARGLVVLVASLLIFGLVRWCVKKVVNGLLHQPADAIFGFLVSGATGFALGILAIFAANHSELVEIHSVLADLIGGYL